MIAPSRRSIAPSGQKSAQTAQAVQASAITGRSSDHEPVWFRCGPAVLTGKAGTRVGADAGADAGSSCGSLASVCCLVQRA